MFPVRTIPDIRRQIFPALLCKYAGFAIDADKEHLVAERLDVLSVMIRHISGDLEAGDDAREFRWFLRQQYPRLYLHRRHL